MKRSALVPFLVLSLPVGALHAQEPTPPPYAAEKAFVTSTGLIANTGSRTALADSRLIVEPGAPSLRVFFRELELGPDDHLDITSVYDGATQRLDQTEVVKWHSSSAFFNGDTLLLELFVAPGSVGAYDTTHLLVGLPGASRSICGSDDRIASFDNRTARFLDSSGNGACSGWMGPNNCAFTAGHCTPSYTRNVAEFNVPPSTGGGSLQHPPPIDQFPFDVAAETTIYTGLGNDWTVTKMLPNSLGELPYTKFGFFNLGFFAPSVGDSMRVTGYGSDSGTTNQIQQTNAGPYFGTSGTSFRYTLDTTGGSSGSVVIHEPTGLAVAIHTNGGCSSSGGYNSGSGNTNAGFQTAYNSICVPPAPPVASFTASPTSALVGTSISFSDTSTGLPTSWAWDFDEDGTTDSTTSNPVYAYTTPGTYDVTLSISNALGADSVTMPNLITINPVTPVTLPYTQDFSGGLPGGGAWGFSSSDPAGSISTGSYGSASPVSGSPSLLMASTQDGGPYVTNEALLHVDLSSASSPQLTYWFKEASDEDHPQDGVFLSDGVTEVQAVSHNGASSNWTQYSVDIAAVAASGGLALTSDFWIMFRQHDNYTMGTDGGVFDDVVVTDGGSGQMLTGSPSTISVSSGGAYTMNLSAGATYGGDTYLVMGTTAGTSPGFTVSGLNLPLNASSYFTNTRFNPNTLISHSMSTLSAGGTATATLSIPAGLTGLAGSTLHHAFVVFATSGPGVSVISSATTGLSLVP